MLVTFPRSGNYGFFSYCIINVFIITYPWCYGCCFVTVVVHIVVAGVVKNI